jgi:hypothetical protein
VGVGVVTVTPIVIKQFTEWLKKVFPPDFDLQIIGVDPEDPNSVRRFLEDFCGDLPYVECKQKVLEVYGGLVKREGEREALEEAIKALEYYFGTPYPSEAFKKLYQKLGDTIVSLLEQPDHGDLRYIEEVLAYRYGCIDFDVRTLSELTMLGFKTNLLKWGDVYLYARQLEYYLNYIPATNITELFGSPFQLGVASRINDIFLVCIQIYREGAILKGAVVASAREPFVLANHIARKYGIIL